MAIKYTDADIVGNAYKVEITPQSKNETYEYKGDIQGSVIFQMVKGNWDTELYSSGFRSFATKAKNGTDLVVNTVFYDTVKGTQKLVTTTIKNFYASGSAYSEAELSQYDTNKNGIDKITVFDDTYLYDEKQFTDDSDYVLAPSKKESETTLNTAGYDTVYDTKGADAYAMVNSSDEKAIYDFDGDDFYDAYDDSYTYVRDFKGNDMYRATGDASFTDTYVDVNDYSGSDIYSANGPSELYVYDYKGNDTYAATNGGIINARDAAGNDTYDGSVGGVIDTGDYLGNDKYIKNNLGWEYEDSAYVDIYDEAGNDTYEFKGDSTEDKVYNITGDIYIEDEKGNDKYTFKNTAAEDGEHNDVEDYAGNDNYDVSESTGLRVFDYAGNDKYDFHDMDGLDGNVANIDMYIYDEKGNDTYNFNNVQYDTLETEYGNIDDDEGNDKYNLNSVQNLVIYDDLGNDIYTITDTISGGLRDSVKYKDYSIAASISDYVGADKYTIKGEENQSYIYGVSVSDSGLDNDTYTVSRAADLELYDEGGNEKYTVSDSEGVSIIDYSGKDAYTITDSSEVSINDGDIQDDKYDVSVKKEFSSEIMISDGGGKETYNIKGKKGKYGIDAVYGVSIQDVGSENDTYNLQYVAGMNIRQSVQKLPYLSSNTIKDEGGDDKYTLASVQDLSIYDKKSGSDKYQISGESAGIFIDDEGGKDTYSIKGTKDAPIQGLAIYDRGESNIDDADTYNVEYALNPMYMVLGKESIKPKYGIYDEGGNNTFNIKNSYGLGVYTTGDGDEKAINKYNFTNASYFSVADSQSDGIYAISSSVGSITDYYGDDTYNISKMKKQDEGIVAVRMIHESNHVSIYDEAGDDNYNVDKLTGALFIQDYEGDDVLSIGGGKNDFVLMSNISYDDDWADGSLLIYDKKNGGFVQISDYFIVSGNKYQYSNNAEGFIESINLSKKEVGTDVLTASATTINNIGEAVANWLDDNDYYSVEECLTEGSKEDVATLVNAFANNDASGLQPLYT